MAGCSGEADTAEPSAEASASAAAGGDGRSAARDAAVRLLARREHSRAELQRKLTARGHAPDCVDAVIAALAAAALQSDERFAEGYARSCLERGQGPLKIRAGLRQRGIDDDLAAAVVDRDDGEWRRLAAAVRRKRFGGASPGGRAEWSKQARFLAARGFSADVVGAVLGDFGDM